MARTRRTTTKKPAKNTARKKATRASKPAARRGGDNEATLRGEVQELLDTLTSSRRPVSLRQARRQFERSYVEFVIRKQGGDRLAAAEKLDIGFSTLKEKIRKTKPR
jgi:DNA-binding NtrC family response regulator